MSAFDQELRARLDGLRAQNLERILRPLDSGQASRVRLDGQLLVNFSSNDYLGLAGAEELKIAAREAVDRFGTGAGASRLISGSLPPHQELEKELARFKGTEAALSFSSGYAAALGVIPAIVGRGDVLILDKLVHACIVDAARLSKATLRIFPHNDLDRLEELLEWARQQNSTGASHRTLVVTESVFSMDGDHAPLREIVALKDRFDAWLMVDEAHACGLYGPGRAGLAEALGVSNRIEIQMGTLGKALGAAGGFICGSRVLVDYLVNRARSLIFSTAPVPAAAAAALAGVRLVRSDAGNELCKRLWRNVQAMQVACYLPADRPASAILPIPIGDERAAVDAATQLRATGLLIPAVRYPSVARGEARLRLTVTAGHSDHDLAQASEALLELKDQLRPVASVGAR